MNPLDRQLEHSGSCDVKLQPSFGDGFQDCHHSGRSLITVCQDGLSLGVLHPSSRCHYLPRSCRGNPSVEQCNKYAVHSTGPRSNYGNSVLRRQSELHPGVGIQAIAGNGFGCVMLRSSVLKDAVFTCRQPPHFDFDPAFYERLQGPGRKVKMNWDCLCEHLSALPEPAA